MRKAVGLFSGGLDSAVAIAVVKAQGIDVVAFHCLSQFGPVADDGGPTEPVKALAAEVGVPLHCHDFTDEQLEMVRHPQFGVGKNLNPCMDCHLAMLRRAEAYRQEIGADFIVSGEVVGQRPMSQRLDSLMRINRESGFRDLILRPLSAHRFPEMIAEREKWVDRSLFPQIEGRTRNIQFALAEKYGLKSYGYPAGGCSLTIVQFCAKLSDLMERQEHITKNDIALLKVGRYVRLDERVRAVVGREEQENLRILALAQPSDVLLQTHAFPGAVVLVRPAPDSEALSLAARIAVHYSKHKEAGIGDVCIWNGQEPPRSGRVMTGIAPCNPADLIIT